MINKDYFQNKKIVIVGLARSGLACANLLYDLDAQVSVTDHSDNSLTRLNATKLKSKKIKVELGRHSPEFIRGKDLVVISPGITDTALPILWAGESKIPVISEIEVGGTLCPATIIAVTGTNGKTTVTTLIGEVLKAKEKKVFVCGNIGNPFSGELEKIKKDDFVSLEVSSFQLEKIKTFKPKIAVILNFSRNHLDRYKNMQEYLEAKKRIFMNQDKTDYLVLNYAEPPIRKLVKEARSSVVYFSRKTEDLNPNQSAVLAVSSILGIEEELVFSVFKKFKGVQHRLEETGRINNITFINDSKATTVDATIWALKNISQPIILIAGGREKGNDYTIIRELMRKKVKELVLIGEAEEKIEYAFRDFLSSIRTSTLKEAVRIAFSKAVPGDCVLLSPMCKSFDMFSDYEERGRIFKKTVYDLIKGKN